MPRGKKGAIRPTDPAAAALERPPVESSDAASAVGAGHEVLPFDVALKYSGTAFSFGAVYTPQTGTSTSANNKWSCYIPRVVEMLRGTGYPLAETRIMVRYEHGPSPKRGYHITTASEDVDKLFAKFRADIMNGAATHCFVLLQITWSKTAHAVTACIQSAGAGLNTLKATCVDNAGLPSKFWGAVLRHQLFTLARGFRVLFDMDGGWIKLGINTGTNHLVEQIERKHGITFKDRPGYCDAWSVVLPLLMMRHKIVTMEGLAAALRPVVGSRDATMAARRLLFIRCFYVVMCDDARLSIAGNPVGARPGVGRLPPRLLLAYENNERAGTDDADAALHMPFSEAIEVARSGVARLAHMAEGQASRPLFTPGMQEAQLHVAFQRAFALRSVWPRSRVEGGARGLTEWERFFGRKFKSDPHILYLGSGWRSWKHFLFKPSYDEARALVENFVIPGVYTGQRCMDKTPAQLKTAYGEWFEAQTGQDRAFLPRHPDEVYGVEAVLPPDKYSGPNFHSDSVHAEMAGTWRGWRHFMCGDADDWAEDVPSSDLWDASGGVNGYGDVDVFTLDILGEVESAVGIMGEAEGTADEPYELDLSTDATVAAAALELGFKTSEMRVVKITLGGSRKVKSPAGVALRDYRINTVRRHVHRFTPLAAPVRHGHLVCRITPFANHRGYFSYFHFVRTKHHESGGHVGDELRDVVDTKPLVGDRDVWANYTHPEGGVGGWFISSASDKPKERPRKFKGELVPGFPALYLSDDARNPPVRVPADGTPRDRLVKAIDEFRTLRRVGKGGPAPDNEFARARFENIRYNDSLVASTIYMSAKDWSRLSDGEKSGVRRDVREVCVITDTMQSTGLAALADADEGEPEFVATDVDGYYQLDESPGFIDTPVMYAELYQPDVETRRLSGVRDFESKQLGEGLSKHDWQAGGFSENTLLVYPIRGSPHMVVPGEAVGAVGGPRAEGSEL